MPWLDDMSRKFGASLALGVVAPKYIDPEMLDLRIVMR